MAKCKHAINVEQIRTDCFAYRCDDRGRLSCTALEELYCGVEGEGPCKFFKPKNRVPMRGTAKTCEYCGKLFIPNKYSKEPKYCSRECGYKGRYIKKHRRTTPGTEVDYGFTGY